MFESESVSRRRFLKGVGAGGALMATPALLAACGGSSGGSTALGGGKALSGKAKKGGTLKLALNGGGTGDTMDAHVSQDGPENFYCLTLYDQLTLVDWNYDLQHRIAEEMVPDKTGQNWTCRIRQGVEFHNGKTVDADDVIFTFNRILNPKTHATGAGQVAMIKAMKKVDQLTVRFELNQPTGWFDLAAGDAGVLGIVPVGYDPQKPVGTGPWKFVSYTPGQQAQFAAFDNYFGGRPLLDTLICPVINDDQSRLSALQSGEVDAVNQLLNTQIPQLKNDTNVVLWNSPAGEFYPITMRVDVPPFNDPRVRKALKLAVNRKQVIESAFGGYAQVGNDVYGLYDPARDKSLVREQDLAQAKSLLKQVGKKISVTLTTSDIGAGCLEQCQVVAANANEAGFNITLNQVDPATLFGPNYLQWPFAVDTYPALHYLTTAALADGPNASINETHWKQPAYEALFNKASQTLDTTTRNEAIVGMQKIMFDEGGFCIPAFPNSLGAHTTNLTGWVPHDYRGVGLGEGTLQNVGFVS